jgi:hypothetical protein
MDTEYHQTTLRFPNDLIARLKLQATLERKSMTALIADLCDLGLQARANTNEDRLDQFRKLVRAAGNVS